MEERLLSVIVKQITNEAEGINTYALVDPGGNALPPFTAGSHINVHIPGGFVRQYSLCNDPRDRLANLAEEGHVFFHHDDGDPGKGLNIAELVKSYEPGTHVYYCGPAGFMHAAKDATAHLPQDFVHFEYFTAPATVTSQSAETFIVKLARNGNTYVVPPDKSIAAVLHENGIEVSTSCEAGICGTCKTRYVEGQPIHNDFVLTDSEKAESVMICCARSATPVLVLDL